MLAHLSENCNTPRVALERDAGRRGETTLQGHGHRGEAGLVVGPFMPGAERPEAPTQYSLF